MVRNVHRCKIKRLGRSSNEQIFTLQNIIEQPLEHCGPLIITYVDFKKFFIASMAVQYGIYWKWTASHRGTLISFRSYMPTLSIMLEQVLVPLFTSNRSPARSHSFTFFLPFSNGLFNEKYNEPATLGRKGNWLTLTLQMTWCYLPIKVGQCS